MDQNRKIIIIIAFLLFMLSLLGLLYSIQPERSPIPPSSGISVDGVFEDWDLIPALYEDPIGDGLDSGLDFGEIYITNDQDYLYIKVDLGKEVNLQSNSNVGLYIDVDANPDTGKLINGLGADLFYDFGDRQGQFFLGDENYPVNHHKISLVALPTVTSSVFEIAINRIGNLAIRSPLFSENIFINFDDLVEGGDTAPDEGMVLEYQLKDDNIGSVEPITLQKDDPHAIRILTFNVLRDGIAYKDREDYFHRLIAAVKPDILNFQELYVFSEKKVIAQIEAWLPLEEGEWHAIKAGNMVTVSRYPIVENWPKSYRPLSNVLPVMLEVNGGKQIVIFNAHLKCCDAEDERQDQADGFVAYIRDAATPGDNVDINPGTPFVLLGDLNLVGYSQQLQTLLDGNIVNEDRFGPDFLPDWDGTPLKDMIPRHTHSLMSYTWSDDESSFAPGRLDFMIYSDSVLQVKKAFVLDTQSLPEDILAEFSLEKDDSANASDHLPVIADIVIEVR